MIWLGWLLFRFRPKPAPTPAPNPAPVKPVVMLGLIEALNAERARYALPELAESDVLDGWARAWVKSMAANGVLTHGNFQQRMVAAVPGRAAGEDIAEGQATVAKVVAAWMASTGHRANILGAYTRVGHGEAIDARGVIYWVVDFAS